MTLPEKIALPAVILLLSAATCMHMRAGYAGDKAWLLLASKMWLEGRRLYVDVVEVNPPLILWLYAIPVWLSLHLAFLTDYTALAIIGLGGSALSAWLGMRLIRLHPAFSGNANRQYAFGLLLLCLFVFFTPATYFFDREHILLVGVFPYMLRFMPGLAGQNVPVHLRVAIGLLAALGFCIKPYTVIVFAGLQLLVLIRERSPAVLWSIENRIVYGASAVYLLCVWRFAPEYIHDVLPMAMITYWAFSRRSIGIFYGILAFITLGVTVADVRLRDASPYRRDIFYFLGIALAFLVYALANNGWGYTFHPLLMVLLLLSAWVFEEQGWLLREASLSGAPVRRFVFGQRACACILLANAAYMVYALAMFFVTPSCEWYADCRRNQPYAQYIQEHNIRSFGALSEDFHKWAALARLTGASFDTRYNALWMVPGLVLEDPQHAASHQWIVTAVGRALAADLDGRKPAIVFVDDRRHFFGTDKDISLAAFFTGVPEFKVAWSRYRYADTIDRCTREVIAACRYDIYRRAP